MLATRERINVTHLAILDKLDANHRELLAALERQGNRISAWKAGWPAWMSAPAGEGERPREP